MSDINNDGVLDDTTDIQAEPAVEATDVQETVTEEQEVDSVDNSGLPEKLPEDSSKQREAFAKMRQLIKELESKNDKDEPFYKYNEGPQVDSYTANQYLQGGEDYLDYDTKINSVMAQAEYKVQQAEKTASAKYEDLEAKMLHPELRKPVSQRSEMETRLIKNAKAHYLAEQQVARMENRTPRTLAQIVSDLKADMGTFTEVSRQEGAKEAQRLAKEKSIASLESGGTTVYAEVDNSRKEQIKDRVRHGEVEALAEELLEDPFFDSFN